MIQQLLDFDFPGISDKIDQQWLENLSTHDLFFLSSLDLDLDYYTCLGIKVLRRDKWVIAIELF